MQLFSIVMVALFVIVFGLAMWKGKTFLRWPLKYRLAIVVPFAGLMFLWIFLGHREADAHELTVMHVCWDAQGHGQYPKGLDEKSTECANPEPFSWSLKPKAVYFNTDKGIYSDYQDSFEEAIKFWNKQLDVAAFKIVKTAEEADITIEFGPVAGEEAGAARHVKTGNVIKGYITLTRPTDINGEYSIMAHELGHAAFGLAHDPTGIMSPTTKSDVMYLVTEPDKRAIRAMLQ